MRVLFSKGIVALSKPRCGSTSLRRMLDPLMAPGDIAVNSAGQLPPFHPHITAPYLRHVLRAQGHDPGRLTFIITVRQPLDMLWSYYKFFRPDGQSRYNFDPKWDESTPMPFEEWVMTGYLGANRKWLARAPDWISPNDLSPLSLEFRAMNRKGRLGVAQVFRIEEPEHLAAWLSARTGQEIKPQHVNRSRAGDRPPVGLEVLAKIRQMLPYESGLYGL